LEETKFRRLGKSETPGYLNTNPIDNFLSFLLVHYSTPNGEQFTELRLSEISRITASGEIWADYTFWHKSGSWQNFGMTSPETLYTKNAVNEHSFVPVTHMAYFDTRFGRYGFLKTK
jgi:hypothetical protein